MGKSAAICPPAAVQLFPSSGLRGTQSCTAHVTAFRRAHMGAGASSRASAALPTAASASLPTPLPEASSNGARLVPSNLNDDGMFIVLGDKHNAAPLPPSEDARLGFLKNTDILDSVSPRGRMPMETL